MTIMEALNTLVVVASLAFSAWRVGEWIGNVIKRRLQDEGVRRRRRRVRKTRQTAKVTYDDDQTVKQSGGGDDDYVAVDANHLSRTARLEAESARVGIYDRAARSLFAQWHKRCCNAARRGASAYRTPSFLRMMDADVVAVDQSWEKTLVDDGDDDESMRVPHAAVLERVLAMFHERGFKTSIETDVVAREPDWWQSNRTAWYQHYAKAQYRAATINDVLVHVRIQWCAKDEPSSASPCATLPAARLRYDTTPSATPPLALPALL